MPVTSSERRFLFASLQDPPCEEDLCRLAAEVVDWECVVDLAVQNEVVPQLHQALHLNIAAVPVAVKDRSRELFAGIALRNLQLEGERRKLTVLLLDAGVSVIPWKGPALASELYGDVVMRSFIDIDLFVPPDKTWKALQLLSAAGYHPDFPLRQESWPSLRRVVNHLTLHNESRTLIVEVHWAPFHPIACFPFDLTPHWRALDAEGGGRAGMLCAEELVVLLCVHATVHRWEKLKWLVDIDRLVRCHNDLDWDKSLAVAAKSGAVRCLRLGLLLAQNLCATPHPEVPELIPEADPEAVRLAAFVEGRLGSMSGGLRGFAACRFDFLSRERWRDRFRQTLCLLFSPRQADWQSFPAGRVCHQFYYVERPLRMLWKWAPGFPRGK